MFPLSSSSVQIANKLPSKQHRAQHTSSSANDGVNSASVGSCISGGEKGKPHVLRLFLSPELTTPTSSATMSADERSFCGAARKRPSRWMPGRKVEALYPPSS